MIEIQKKEGSNQLQLAIDGVVYTHTPLFTDIRINSTEGYYITLFGSETGENDILLEHCFSDLPKELIKIDSFGLYKLLGDAVDISHYITIYQDMRQFYLVYTFEFDSDNWKRLWSVSEYVEEFSRVLEQQTLSRLGQIPEDFLDHNFAQFDYRLLVSLSVRDAKVPIKTEMLSNANVKILKQLHELTEMSLMSKLRQESLVMQFEFPEEVRIPCEQYLVYFVQFLKDLGVEATADFQHQAGEVLFAVTPVNKDEALDKIRAALETYLQLPSNPASNSMNVEQEIAIQRLTANIDHLKGQLRLAHAELRLAGATMQTQQITINHLLSGEVIIESLKNVTPEPDRGDKEELLDGTVALTKFNWKGVEFNLPEIFRRLRRLFREGE